METNYSTKYLSLKTAAQLYGYTRDHLGLMIRQNKLKGKKLGNYYVTTSEWVFEYVKNYANPRHSTAKNKLSNRFISDILSTKKESQSFKKPAVLIKEKPDKHFTEKPENKLQKEILKELLNSRQDALKKEAILSSSDSPYIILPVRKMTDIEKKRILNMTSNDRNEIDSI